MDKVKFARDAINNAKLKAELFAACEALEIATKKKDTIKILQCRLEAFILANSAPVPEPVVRSEPEPDPENEVSSYTDPGIVGGFASLISNVTPIRRVTKMTKVQREAKKKRNRVKHRRELKRRYGNVG